MHLKEQDGIGQHGLDYLVHNWDKWHALVNRALNLQIPGNA